MLADHNSSQHEEARLMIGIGDERVAVASEAVLVVYRIDASVRAFCMHFGCAFACNFDAILHACLMVIAGGPDRAGGHCCTAPGTRDVPQRDR